MQLSRHIAKAAWSSADKALYLSLAVVYFIPQKVIGEAQWGLFTISQAILTTLYLLADGFALQILVNFGVVEERRREAMTISALLFLLFIGTWTAGVYFGREMIADFTSKPDLIPILALFPLVSASFIVRNFTLKIAQMEIDTRATFIIDAAWVATMSLLLLHGWTTEWLTTAVDMMYVAAGAAAGSSLIGLWHYRRTMAFARRVSRQSGRQMVRFGVTQLGSSATIAAQSQGDLLILGTLVSEAMVGNYDVAKKFFRGFEGIRDAGALFVYPAVARLSSQHRTEELRVLVEKMIAFTAIVITPIVLFVWFGPIEAIFEVIYRDSYQEAPYLFRIISLAALAIPFAMNSYVVLGMSQVRKLFMIALSSVVVFFVVSLLLVPRIGVEGQAWGVVASFWSMGLLSWLTVRKLVPITAGGILGRRNDVLEFFSRTWTYITERIRRKGS